MPRKIICYESPKRKPTFIPPDIPEEMWYDFRQDYESGLTLKEIAIKYYCDPRTVRRCILQNRPSSDLGKQTEPTKLAPYVHLIDDLFQDYIDNTTSDKNCKNSNKTRQTGICKISIEITATLKALGYEGCERSVRNYIRNKYQYVNHSQLESKEKNHVKRLKPRLISTESH